MKRSQINRALREMEALMAEYRFELPDFCHWTPADWAAKDETYDEIRDNMLGWDVTDYGQGDFEKMGLVLITLRNGNVHGEKYKKPYSEKIIMGKEGQLSPMHFHWNKMEDIINRGGGDVVFTLYNATPEGALGEGEVQIFQDGRRYTVPAGAEVVLKPGQSLTLYPYCYHAFVVRPGTGPALIGEVSTCNDDENDNRFLDELGRFPAIEEDEPPWRLLCSEYPRPCAAAAGEV